MIFNRSKEDFPTYFQVSRKSGSNYEKIGKSSFSMGQNPPPQNTGFLALFHCFDTVFNNKKSVFYAGFGISTPENPGIRSLLTYVSLKIEKRSKTVKKPVFTVANSTVLTGFEQQNLKKHDA